MSLQAAIGSLLRFSLGLWLTLFSLGLTDFAWAGRKVAVTVEVQSSYQDFLNFGNFSSAYNPTISPDLTHLRATAHIGDDIRGAEGLNAYAIQIRRSLEEQLLPDDEVHLVTIITHGQDYLIPGLRSMLNQLGRINEHGLSPHLARALAPLQGRLVSDADVVLLPCQLMRGSEASQRRRIQRLAEFFGNHEGHIFASEGLIVLASEDAHAA